MKEVKILRMARSSHGTEGRLLTEGFVCYSFELPWKNNERAVSCIPPGEYNCVIRVSPKYGRTYWVSNVPERSLILIHSGNFAGDPTIGLKTHTMGCILLGGMIGFLGGQKSILNSRVIVRRFMEHMNYEPFVLNVNEAFV
jgi:hypothetical protein